MEEDTSFFDKERDRLTAEISSVSINAYNLRAKLTCARFIKGFEELLSSSNNLNRKLEEVLGMTREYETIAALWQSFHELMRGHHDRDVEGDAAANAGAGGGAADAQEHAGLPGTGGHVLAASTAARSGGAQEGQDD